MTPLSLTGMRLKEAKKALEKEGISDYQIVVTGPPRLLDRTINDDLRVVIVNMKAAPIQVIVCKS